MDFLAAHGNGVKYLTDAHAHIWNFRSIYEVSSILGKYIDKEGIVSYRVQWAGFPKTTIEPARNLLETAEKLVNAFETKLAQEIEAAKPQKKPQQLTPVSKKRKDVKSENEMRPKKRLASSTTGDKHTRKKIEAFSPLRQCT